METKANVLQDYFLVILPSSVPPGVYGSIITLKKVIKYFMVVSGSHRKCIYPYMKRPNHKTSQLFFRTQSLKLKFTVELVTSNIGW